MRQTNTGIARRPFHHGAAGLEQTLLFGLQQDPQRGPVLDGATGVHELGLAEDLATG